MITIDNSFISRQCNDRMSVRSVSCCLCLSTIADCTRELRIPGLDDLVLWDNPFDGQSCPEFIVLSTALNSCSFNALVLRLTTSVCLATTATSHAFCLPPLRARYMLVSSSFSSPSILLSTLLDPETPIIRAVCQLSTGIPRSVPQVCVGLPLVALSGILCTVFINWYNSSRQHLPSL